jgi:hypothetical protein
VRRLPSGRNAASRRLTSNTNETLNLRAIRASEAKFSHKREMKRSWRGSSQEASAKRWGRR